MKSNTLSGYKHSFKESICATTMGGKPEFCKGLSHVSINGTDDRFTQKQNTLGFLEKAFENTGELVGDKKCRIRGSGFINNGGLTTARHVICGMIENKCDMSKIKLRNKVFGWSYPIKKIGVKKIDCRDDNDVLKLSFKSKFKKKGLQTASVREVINLFKSKDFLSCHIVGMQGDTKLLQASEARHLKPRKINGVYAFVHCADTYPRSSGGPLVCKINGVTKALGVNSFSAFNNNKKRRVKSCNPENINDNGSWATYLDKQKAYEAGLIESVNKACGISNKQCGAKSYELSIKYRVGSFKYRDGSFKPDYKKSATYLIQAADKKYPSAYLDLAMLHESGKYGAIINAGVLASEYKKAFAKKSIKFFWDYKRLFELSDSFEPDADKAANYYFKALEAGDASLLNRKAKSWNLKTGKALQLLLKDDGYYTGAIDGILGKGTKAAFRKLCKCK